MLYNLRTDPFERGTGSQLYASWFMHRVFMLVPAQVAVARYIESFKDFLPRTKPASFTVSDVMEKLTTAGANKNQWQTRAGRRHRRPVQARPNGRY
jgi:hypothetical protein